MEQARLRAGTDGYEGLDLRDVPVPQGKDGLEQWAASLVQSHLGRIAGNHRRARDHAKMFEAATFVTDTFK